MKNIVLVGLMGAGKSTIGKILAQKLEFDFWDTDSIIEQEQNKSISEIFSQNGEQYFRTLENQIVSKISSQASKVIATGGGTLMQQVNIEALKKNGILIYLQAPADVLFERIKNSKHRPLLLTENPLFVLENLLQSREEKYLLSDYVLNTVGKNIDSIVDEIMKVYNENT